MQKMKKAMGLEEVKGLLDATFTIFDAHRDKKKGVVDIHAEIQYLSMYIEKLITRSVLASGKGVITRKEANAAIANYRRLKLGIQEAIATGFQISMEKFSETPMEYYCIIQPTEEVSSVTSH